MVGRERHVKQGAGNAQPGEARRGQIKAKKKRHVKQGMHSQERPGEANKSEEKGQLYHGMVTTTIKSP